jgi:hypothetical protein
MPEIARQEPTNTRLLRVPFLKESAEAFKLQMESKTDAMKLTLIVLVKQLRIYFSKLSKFRFEVSDGPSRSILYVAALLISTLATPLVVIRSGWIPWN